MLITKLVEKIRNKNINIEHIIFVVKYLKKYGYLDKASESLDEFIDSLVKFQNFFGLKPDGELGVISLEKFLQPRCDVPDFITGPEFARLNKWNKKILTYLIRSRVKGIPADTIDEILEEVMQDAMENCDLKIVRTNSNNADLILDTGNSRSEEFGSSGGVLAWAYLPQGDNRQLLMKFDLAETWVTNGNGILFKNVAAHEIAGHMLGLPHSQDKRSLMYPMYQRSISSLQKIYDIPELQKRYGKPVSQPEPEPEPEPNPDPIPTPNPSGKTIINIEGNITNISIPGYRVNKID